MKTVLCGIGGYGASYYLKELLDREDSPVQLAGFVDPVPEKSPYFQRIRESGLPLCSSLEDFYGQHTAELAIISSPIQFHCSQTLLALSRGSHVLCEKPLCGSLDEARQMIEARRRSGLVLAIGYQRSYIESTRRLKADILDGEWGRPLSARMMTLWPRSLEYYGRNAWAGSISDAAGRPVMDSPVNNATAHYLHQMLYLLGDSMNRSAVPEEVEAQLYRAHDIANYDTAMLRCRTAGGAQIFFVTSHVGTHREGPAFEMVFERGRVWCDDMNGEVLAEGPGGLSRNYGPADEPGIPKILDTVAAIREGRESLCGPEAAASQTLCMLAAQESGSPVVEIPGELVREVEDKDQHWVEVEGFTEILKTAYKQAVLPGPDAAPWIRPARTVPVPRF